MESVTREKLAQACGIVAAAEFDVWLTFVRETAAGGDPVLPLVLECGLTWQSALLVSAVRKVAIVGNYDAPALRVSGDWDEVVPYVEGIRPHLLEQLERLIPRTERPPRIAVNFSLSDDKADGLTHGMFLQLEEYLGGTRFQGCLHSGEEILSALRSRKTPEELRRIRAAVAETDVLFGEIAAFARPGRSEREIYECVQARMEERRLGFAWDRSANPIVNAGPESIPGHGAPSPGIRLAPGHILHVDLGVIRDGYCSDMQRCWYAPRDGERALPSDVTRAFEIVSGAISAGAGALKPGELGWRVDAAARRFIVRSGENEYLHALGHQVGRLAHDGGAVLGPQWERYGRTPYMPLEAGQVFTLELGVVVKDRGYLGLEEMVVVTDRGCEWLTGRPRTIPLLG
jgi:Xaa-Pro dipeptidase